jgi:hypothetical protein
MNIAFIAVWGNSAVQVTPATTYKNFRNVTPTEIPLIPNSQISAINTQHLAEPPPVIDLLDWLS